MNETTTDLLKRAESYLSALHGSVARHDNLAANLGCAGCELRDQIGAALRADATVPAPAPTDQTALRKRIAQALCGVLPASSFQDVIADDAAAAVLAVLPEPADRAAVLREAADDLATAFGDPMAKHIGIIAANYLRRRARKVEAADGPGRMADEAPANIQCTDAFWTKQPHTPHDWQQRPDARPVHCPGVADEAQQPEAATDASGAALDRALDRAQDADEQAITATARAKRAEAERDTAVAAFNKVTLELWDAKAALGRVRAELDRVAQLDTVTFDDGRADSFAVGARWTLRMIREALDDTRQPMDDSEECLAEPPGDGTWGDCWCTLPPGHTGEHRCQPCTDRHGARGWTDHTAAVSQPGKEATS